MMFFSSEVEVEQKIGGVLAVLRCDEEYADKKLSTLESAAFDFESDDAQSTESFPPGIEPTWNQRPSCSTATVPDPICFTAPRLGDLQRWRTAAVSHSCHLDLVFLYIIERHKPC